MTVVELRRTIIVDAPPDAVFRSITDTTELAKWLAKDAKMEARVGGEVGYSLRPDDRFGVWGLPSGINGKVLEVEQDKKLSYTWDAETPGGEVQGVITWVLDPLPSGKTSVTVIQSGVPEGIREESLFGLTFALGRLQSFCLLPQVTPPGPIRPAETISPIKQIASPKSGYLSSALKAVAVVILITVAAAVGYLYLNTGPPAPSTSALSTTTTFSTFSTMTGSTNTSSSPIGANSTTTENPWLFKGAYAEYYGNYTSGSTSWYLTYRPQVLRFNSSMVEIAYYSNLTWGNTSSPGVTNVTGWTTVSSVPSSVPSFGVYGYPPPFGGILYLPGNTTTSTTTITVGSQSYTVKEYLYVSSNEKVGVYVYSKANFPIRYTVTWEAGEGYSNLPPLIINLVQSNIPGLTSVTSRGP